MAASILMDTAAYIGRGKKARREVKARVQRFFTRLKDELDKDTDDFFDHVMEQAKRDNRVSMECQWSAPACGRG
jgi:hypothetical protein